MKKLILFVTVAMLVFSSLAYAGGNFGPVGPAPNAGDGIPDGSGFNVPNGPNGIGIPGYGNGPMGPAPNAGDCVPDGSGFDLPNGPNWK